MTNLSDRLAARKMPQRDVAICLNLDLLEQRDAAMRSSTRPRSGVEDDRMVRLTRDEAGRARLEEIERQIQEESITIRVKGVDRFTYNQWLVACPPRKGKQEPFDPTTFFMHAAKHSAVYVDEAGVENEISDEEWASIDKMLTDGEHDRIAQAVVHVNRSVGTVDVGFFANASEMTPGSSGISGSPSKPASRHGGSGAGSRKKSTSKTSTSSGDDASE